MGEGVISQFAANNAGEAEVTAMVSVHRPDAAATDIREVHAVAGLKDQTVGASAASLSQALGQVADEAAQDLRGMAATQPEAASTSRRH